MHERSLTAESQLWEKKQKIQITQSRKGYKSVFDTHVGRWSVKLLGRSTKRFAGPHRVMSSRRLFVEVRTAKGVNIFTTTTPSIVPILGRIRYLRSALPAFFFLFSSTRTGTVQHDDRVLQPGADLADVLRPDRAAVLHDAPPLAGRLRRVLRDQLQHHPPVWRSNRFLLPGVELESPPLARVK